ncbi:histidinol-phosphate aminotransferase [Dysgonomonadaceae bacterium PH5-43]|nr:histidinol-phosphate aminotransferase [Dysgonomonadaceae bacterium PH5-43]
MNLETLVRPNIWKLKPYSSARSEFKGEASVFLDANENPYNFPYNRYPDPLQHKLKDKIAKLKGVRSSQIMIGNGSDEPIDLVFRIFCEPGVDNVVAIDPTYGMYEVCADINNVSYRKVLLREDYSLDAEAILKAVDKNTKLIFLCSPNNPTGNLLNREEMLKVVSNFEGIVIIDEAYVDFSSEQSWLNELDSYPNVVVLQTFSKAWGLASVRCGLAFASEEIISFFNKVKYPYNINLLTQDFVSTQLDKEEEKKQWVDTLIKERATLKAELEKLDTVEKVYPSEANSLLVKVKDANGTYQTLVDKGIVVRNRNSVSLCLNCLRITIGSPQENAILLKELKTV